MIPAGGSAGAADSRDIAPPASEPIKVLYLIRSLDLGGAERQIIALARGHDRASFKPLVVSIYSGGVLESDLREAGVALESLNKAGRWDLIAAQRRLAAILKSFRPAILHGSLATGNLMALAGRRAVPDAKLIWGWRSSALDYSHYGAWTRWSEALERRLSGRVDLVVANAEAGKRDQLARGAAARRIAVVPNGIDVARFKPDPQARRELRADWGLEPGDLAIGLVARLDPMKGHGIFLEAAARAAALRPGLRFVVIGSGATEALLGLQRRAEELGIAERLVWAGQRLDVQRALAALDLSTSASLFGEGFSNALAEAMASGLPCAATDVGDAAKILGDCGLIVPPGDAEALASAWLALLQRLQAEGEELRAANRRRIVEAFSVEAMVTRTEALYRQLLSGDDGVA